MDAVQVYLLPTSQFSVREKEEVIVVVDKVKHKHTALWLFVHIG